MRGGSRRKGLILAWLQVVHIFLRRQVSEVQDQSRPLPRPPVLIKDPSGNVWYGSLTR